MTDFNAKIRLLLNQNLNKTNSDIASLSNAIAESEADVKTCFDNPAKSEPRILFKISKELGIERDMLILMQLDD